MRCILMSILFWCWFVAGNAAAGAELESKVDQPYEVVVCLKFFDDPGFTPRFVESVRRQVHDQLANYFAELADVKTVCTSALAGGRDVANIEAALGKAKAERLSALLEKAEATGLAELNLSPAEFMERGLPDKVFLVTIDFDGGMHRIEARQLDGDVQQIGTPFRRSTPDRQWLAKAVSLAVKEDFAPVALFEPDPYEKDKVRLHFRGAGRTPGRKGGPSRLQKAWLADGCVLQPFWVTRQHDGSLARQPIPHTVLQIEPGQNSSRATVVSSLREPLKRTARVAAFQAIKLATRSGRFRLRLLDAETGEPLLADTAMVYANSTGFDDLGPADLLLSHDRNGYVVAEEPLGDVAYIKISLGGGSDVRIALPMTDDWVERELRLRIDATAEKPEWLCDLRYVVQDLQVLQTMMDGHVRAVNDYNQKKQLKPALQRVESATGALRNMVGTARRDVEDLKRRAQPLHLADNSLLVWADRQIAEIEQREKEFQALAKSLEERIAELDAGHRADVLIKLAQQAENAGNIDDAIDKYKLALQEWPQLPQVKQHLDELKETWRIKGPDHEDARQFVFGPWAKAKMRELQRLLPQAGRAFEVIKRPDVDDQITARRLLRTNGEHLSELTELVDWLADRPDDQSRRELEEYGKLTERLVELQLQVSKYLEARSQGRQPETRPAREEEPAAADDKSPPGGEKPVPGDEKPVPERPGSEEEEQTEEPLQP